MDSLERMREFDPGLYEQWKRELQAQAAHNRKMELLPVQQPAKVAKRGQLFGLISVLGVLGIAGFAVQQGQAWMAAVLVSVDVIALAAVFNGNTGGHHKH